MGLNGALMNWALQSSLSLPNYFDQVRKSAEILNPILTDENFKGLKDKMDSLKLDIDKLKEER